MARLALEGYRAQLGRLVRTAGAISYGGWWWIVVAVTLALAWLAAHVLPLLEWRWATVRALARAALALMRIPLTVRGREHLPQRGAVLTFNHASYADALILAATLPGAPAFAAKKELAGQFFAGSFLRRLGTCFIERYAVLDSIADTEAVENVARAGRLLVFFPEGTFSRRTGLTGFYLGAFKVACKTGLPVVPGAIRGARTMLRGEQWLPRWTRVSVEFAEPTKPAGADFSSIVKLRDAVRSATLARCSEPDLNELATPAPQSGKRPAN
jgi:1-acyl-sn-glycerol-3-phosphate acyltransferase